MTTNLSSFTDILSDFDEIADSQPLSLSAHRDFEQPYSELEENNQTNRTQTTLVVEDVNNRKRPAKYTGQRGEYRSIEEIDEKYQSVFTYPLFNLVQSKVIDDALYSDKSMVVCAPTGSGKTVIFEMAIIQLLQELEEKNYKNDFKIIYMAPVKSLCTERLTDWYSKFTPLGLLCVEVTGDTDVDFPQLKPYRIIITTPEKWDILTRRWRDHRSLVEVIKLFLIDEVHILNDNMRGPVLEAVVSRMKTIESSAQSAHRIEQLQQHYQENSNETVNQNYQENPTVSFNNEGPPRIRFVAVSATVNNPEDVAAWLGTDDRPAVYHKFGDECRPVKLNRVVEGYPCPEGMSIFKFDIVLNYKLWPIIQKYHNGKPTLIFCNTRKSVELTAETLSKELTITFTPEQKAKLTAVASTIKNRKIKQLILSGVGCHHAGLLYEERINIEQAFRNRDLPILITTTTLAMGVNLPAHLVIIKNTQQYVKGAYQEYSISTVLQMVGRAGRPQFDTEATAVIMTRLADKPRYQLLVGGSEPLQSYLHKRLAENLNSEVALGTVSDVAQCVQWLQSTFLYVRAAKDPKWYLGLPVNAPHHHILKKIEELCVKAMNGLASSGLITMDEASCIESTEAGRLMSLYYLDLETMKHIMKIKGTETLDQLLWIICESHELADMHLRMDERRCLNALNRNNQAATIRFPMKGKINTRQMKLNCMIQAVLGCLPISEPALNQEASKVMRIADRVCKCLVAYVTRPELVNEQPDIYTVVLNSIVLAKCIAAHLWENSPYVSKQLRGIGPTFSTLLATAGKVNFLLLEESHPRDLERIMNKSAPAGNVIRKQISLLPKYQITATPVDEKRVTIQISLLNQTYLAENLEDLTAGPSHKSFIVIGDSKNHLLMLTSFKDKDFISVYDGTITHEIPRKHSFEHKILAHCVSSTFVGIDVHCEYVFKSLEMPHCRGVSTVPVAIPPATSANKPTKRQTCITDVFKERKRKTNEDIAQSKEKKKRENTLMSKLKDLKKSLESASSEAKEDEVYEEMSQSEIVEGGSGNYQTISHFGNIKTPLGDSEILSEYEYPDVVNNDSPEDVMADEKIESILNEIESEISKKGATEIEKHVLVNKERDTQSSYFVNSKKEAKLSFINQPQSTKFIRKSFKVPYSKLKQSGKNSHSKSNFNFIEHLEKNVSPNDDVESYSTNQNTFSDAIKSQVEKFLQQTRETNVKKPNYMTIIDERPFDKSYKEEDQLSSMDIETEKQSIYSVPINTQVIENKNILDGNISDEIDECTTHADQEGNRKNSYASYGENYDLLPERDYHESNFYLESNLTYSKNIVMDLTKLDDPSYNMKGSQHVSPGHKMTKNLNKMEDKELPTIDLTVNSIIKENDTPVINLIGNTKYNHMEQNSIISEPFEPTIVSDPNEINALHNSADYAQSVCHEIIHKPQIYNDCLELNENGVVADYSTLELETIHNLLHKNSPKLLNTESEKELVYLNLNKAETIESNTELTSPKYSFDNSVVNSSDQELNDIASLKYILNEQKQPRKTEIEVINKPHIKSLQETAVTEGNSIVQKQTIGSKLDTATEEKFPLLSIDPLITFVSNDLIINHETTNSPIGLLYSNHMKDNENNTVKSIKKKLEVESYINAPVFNTEYNSHEGYNGPYINKYSFTATKIDVNSKNNPHNIKIIRRVKLDVDVTEIISKNENYSSVDKTVSSEVKSTDKKKIPEEILSFKNNVKDNGKMQNEVIKDTNLDGTTEVDEAAFGNRQYNKTKSFQKLLKLKTFPFPVKQNENENKRYHTKEDQFKEISKQEIEVKNDCEHKIMNSFRRSNEVEPAKQKEGTVQYCTETENFEEIRKQNIHERQPQTLNSNRRNNDVENILKKYSKIFQKNLMNATEKRKVLAETASKQETKSSYETVMKQNQYSRAYSINKLNNSNISLPKAIVEVSKKSTPTPMLTNAVILSKIKALEPTKYEVNGNLFNYKQNLRDQNMEDLHEEKEIEYLSPPAIPSATQEAPLSEIDQSLFNPKTVLQCFSRESPEYIPPPLEFCDDNISYSPTQSEFGDNENECEVNQLPSQETKQNLSSVHHASTPTNSSIFNKDNDCDRNVLTPSREIETWTLRREEFTPNFEYNRNPLKSFTVMRKNSPASNLDSRNTKLHNFKFTPKNKLRFK